MLCQRSTWYSLAILSFLCSSCLTPCEREELLANKTATGTPVSVPASVPAVPEAQTAPAATPPESPNEALFAALIQEYKAEKTANGLHIRLLTDPIFPPSKTEFSQEARPKMEALAATLAKLQDVSVRAEAYTDSSGQKAKNLQISKQRAARLLELLNKAGTKSAKAEGFGDANPLADNKTPEGRKNNRRFEIYVAATPVPTAPAAAPAIAAEPVAPNSNDAILQGIAKDFGGELTSTQLHVRLLTDPIFPPSKTEFAPDALPQLEKLAAQLAQLQGKAVRIETYTDSSGQKAKNLQISKQRAARILDLLNKAGVKQAKAEGLGDANPVADNKTPEGRKGNRRFEIYVEDGK